ncbi:MAG: 5'-methylthioadenosine/S-adenosylhomocysteine nucleosidase [Acutalibacteraceae bacterium]|nr:5'-methylthioadenosine/S-adenosylhomocysteine nucleosidase [Acutalibacteraceae bacterium]
MKDTLKIGYVVADEDEYAPLRGMAGQLSACRRDFFAREGHVFSFEKDNRTIQVHAILCGIGMINATAATTYLATQGCDIIINSGLSGGISGIRRGELTVGTEYIEHDFDLTPLGYKPCQKPLQNYIYKADEDLVNVLCDIFPVLKRGVAVSGDSFISDEAKKNYLKNTFGAMSCDMESAAVAYVCEQANIRYAAIRRISDDAGDDATQSYCDMNNLQEAVLVQLFVDAVKRFFDYDILWK